MVCAWKECLVPPFRSCSSSTKARTTALKARSISNEDHDNTHFVDRWNKISLPMVFEAFRHSRCCFGLCRLLPVTCLGRALISRCWCHERVRRLWQLKVICGLLVTILELEFEGESRLKRVYYRKQLKESVKAYVSCIMVESSQSHRSHEMRPAKALGSSSWCDPHPFWTDVANAESLFWVITKR